MNREGKGDKGRGETMEIRRGKGRQRKGRGGKKTGKTN